jgi:hypothetical protein
MGDPITYRDATEAESAQVLKAARAYLGTSYETIGFCDGLVCKAIRDSVNKTFPLHGTVGFLIKDPGLRLLSADETERAGDVMVWGTNHMGFLDPNPSAGVPKNYTALSARGRPGGKNNPGVAYGLPEWFHPQPATFWRVRVPCIPNAPGK